MIKPVLSVLFWIVGVGLVALSAYQGGWALFVPAGVAVALVIFALDLHRHREIVVFDLDLLRTLLHVLAAVALATWCMYWLGRLLLAGGA
ncbi:MAG: hypothetical protein Kow0092_20140 [Deferrisomatales bacterium]